MKTLKVLFVLFVILLLPTIGIAGNTASQVVSFEIKYIPGVHPKSMEPKTNEEDTKEKITIKCQECGSEELERQSQGVK